MPPGARRRKIIFPGRQVAAAAGRSAAQREANMFISHLPSWLRDQPLIEEELDTESSDLQLETAEECLPFLKRTFPPSLEKTKHVRFLEGSLGRLPAGFAALDASRPWMLYWALSALGALGEDLTEWRENVIDTLRPIQNKTGGFGGGHGQLSHLATTYASVLSLVMVGGDEAFELIDRKAMLHWLGSLKSAEGDFAMSAGGERDVRAAYCVMVVLSLLNLPLELPIDSPGRVKGTETFMTGLAEYVSRCQTYEGGIGCAPGAEAHGAYAFCGIACLCIMGEPHVMLHKYLDMSSLLSWLSARQHAPEGGLGGRTNKLVDGCYSHWIGGCWALVSAAIEGGQRELWNREGLLRYILCCCQNERGGLRDKPSKNPDAYHTCYNLAGLSAAQNYTQYIPHTPSPLSSSHTPATSSTPASDDTGYPPLTAGFHWKTSKTPFPSTGRDRSKRGSVGGAPGRLFYETDRAGSINPVYVVPAGKAEEARTWFEGRGGVEEIAEGFRVL